MRPIAALLILLAVALPSITSGEVLYLKDGSTLKGTLVRVVDSVLVFRTSFGAEFEIERTKIAKIVFSDSIEAAAPASPSVPQVAEAAGSLLVVLEDMKLSSKIVVNRGRELEEHIAANAVVQEMLISGTRVAVAADTVIDKVITQGSDTEYKNNFKPERMLIELPPGLYQGELIVRNAGLPEFESAFEGRPIDYSLILSNIEILSNTTTVIRVRHKGGRMGLGKGSLVVAR